MEQITAAIQAACNEELERGRARMADAKAALHAALEELTAARKDRDAFALALTYRCPVCGGDGAVTGCGPNDEPVQYECAQCAPAYRHIASHDRAVAARVLRDAEGYIEEPIECSTLLRLADQYERGEREVPA